MFTNMKGKTKNNMKVRMDLDLYCDHESMELVSDRFFVTKPKTIYRTTRFIPSKQALFDASITFASIFALLKYLINV
jgi:hypothetical protein